MKVWKIDSIGTIWFENRPTNLTQSNLSLFGLKNIQINESGSITLKAMSNQINLPNWIILMYTKMFILYILYYKTFEENT